MAYLHQVALTSPSPHPSPNPNPNQASMQASTELGASHGGMMRALTMLQLGLLAWVGVQVQSCTNTSPSPTPDPDPDPVEPGL